MASEAGVLELGQRLGFRSRVCQVTGLRVDWAAERLITVNAVTAVVFLLVGGVMALFVSMTRWPAVGLLSGNPELFYRFLTAHGMNMLVYWIIFFEVAGLYFGGAVPLNARLVTPWLAWLGYALMLAGALLGNATVLSGRADVMWDAYVPLETPPAFFLSYIIFAAGALVACYVFFATVIVAKVEGRYRGSLPLVTYGFATAAIIAVVTLLGGVFTFVPAFFWSLGLMHEDPEAYRLTIWLLGHGTQQINLAAMVSVWYLIAYLAVGAQPVSEKLSRLAFVLYILFINLGSVHHLLVDPGLSRSFKYWNTSYAMYAAVLGSMIHAFSIPAAVEVAQRAKGYTRGLFEWLRKAPWGNPAFAGAALSLLGFGFIGGTTGVAFGHGPTSILHHNTIAIPGHFHATVVLGTTLAFMGVTYYVLPLVCRRKVVGWRLAQVQPYIFALGVALLAVALMNAGAQFGVPRRVVSIAYQGAPFPVHFPAAAYRALNLAGVGAVLALVGGALYIGIAVSTLIWGERIPAGAGPLMEQQAEEPTGAEARLHIPGTVVLVSVFLLFFIGVLVANMGSLLYLWPVH
ncbi:MAG: cbb3-type cytochrome c oxidase subunit I [Deltaproteobacteria bacterium]|nr:cbb3-type cytochrome c oxidase subunit I [Deltaproteobacteria bacterium]